MQSVQTLLISTITVRCLSANCGVDWPETEYVFDPPFPTQGFMASTASFHLFASIKVVLIGVRTAQVYNVSSRLRQKTYLIPATLRPRIPLLSMLDLGFDYVYNEVLLDW